MLEVITELEETDQGCQDCLLEQRQQEGPGARGQEVGGPVGHGSRTRRSGSHRENGRRTRLKPI